MNMRYVFYFLTIAIFFAAGMIVGNLYLPQQSAVLASSVSVPELSAHNPILSQTSRETADQELTELNQALDACPVIVGEEKDRLVNHIKLMFALSDFELKKARLELEMAKNNDSNRPTAQFLQATTQYNAAREYVEKLADELFPVPEPVAEETEEPAPPEETNEEIAAQ
jgi:hypothetical protein